MRSQSAIELIVRSIWRIVAPVVEQQLDLGDEQTTSVVKLWASSDLDLGRKVVAVRTVAELERRGVFVFSLRAPL